MITTCLKIDFTFSPASESISSDINDSCEALILKSELKSSQPAMNYTELWIWISACTPSWISNIFLVYSTYHLFVWVKIFPIFSYSCRVGKNTYNRITFHLFFDMSKDQRQDHKCDAQTYEFCKILESIFFHFRSFIECLNRCGSSCYRVTHRSYRVWSCDK